MIKIYTDGSLVHYSDRVVGGWAYLIHVHDAEGKFLGEQYASGSMTNTSIDRMELYAILRGLQAVTGSCNIEVFCDNKGIVEMATKNLAMWAKRKFNGGYLKNADLWEAIWSVAHYHNIKMTWIRSHTGNTNSRALFNSKVDEMAKKATLTAGFKLPDFGWQKYQDYSEKQRKNSIRPIEIEVNTDGVETVSQAVQRAVESILEDSGIHIENKKEPVDVKKKEATKKAKAYKKHNRSTGVSNNKIKRMAKAAKAQRKAETRKMAADKDEVVSTMISAVTVMVSKEIPTEIKGHTEVMQYLHRDASEAARNEFEQYEMDKLLGEQEELVRKFVTSWLADDKVADIKAKCISIDAKAQIA